MIKIKKSTLLLSNLKMNPSQIHKFRGFVGNLFRDEDLIHNHDMQTGRSIYRYPLIQFKRIDDTPAIIAVTERAVSVFMQLFMKLEHIQIERETIPVFEKDLKIEETSFGFTAKPASYEFNSPWIGLNQKNYLKYRNATKRDKNKILQSALIGNILAMAKGVGYWLEKEQRVEAKLQVRECPVNLKGRTMMGFNGRFQTNFVIPDFVGIGKAVSRGFGVAKRIM